MNFIFKNFTTPITIENVTNSKLDTLGNFIAMYWYQYGFIFNFITIVLIFLFFSFFFEFKPSALIIEFLHIFIIFALLLILIYGAPTNISTYFDIVESQIHDTLYNIRFITPETKIEKNILHTYSHMLQDFSLYSQNIRYNDLAHNDYNIYNNYCKNWNHILNSYKLDSNFFITADDTLNTTSNLLVGTFTLVEWFFGVIFIFLLFLFILLFTDRFFTLENDRIEFATLILLIGLSGILLLVATNIIEIFLLLECISLSGFVLIGFEKHRKPTATIGIQYLIISSIPAALFVLGIALLYLQTGNVSLWNYDLFSNMLENKGPDLKIDENLNTLWNYDLSNEFKNLFNFQSHFPQKPINNTFQKCLLYGNSNIIINNGEWEIAKLHDHTPFNFFTNIVYNAPLSVWRSEQFRQEGPLGWLAYDFEKNGLLDEDQFYDPTAWFSNEKKIDALMRQSERIHAGQRISRFIHKKELVDFWVSQINQNPFIDLKIQCKGMPNFGNILGAKDGIYYTVRYNDITKQLELDTPINSGTPVASPTFESKIDTFWHFLTTDKNINFNSMIHKYDNLWFPILFILGVSFLLINLFFKITAAPFHAWAPIIYQNAPTASVVFLSIFVKLVIFIFMLSIFSTAFYSFNIFWGYLILFSSFLSIILGILGAFNEKLLKRFIVYSSMTHVGFILLSLPFVWTTNGERSLVEYAIVYTFSSMLLWTLLLISTPYPLTYINTIKKLLANNAILILIFTLNMFSMGGIPPLAGFFVKFDVLYSILQSSYFYLGILIFFLTVISFFYYMRIVKILFFEKIDWLSYNLKLKYTKALVIVLLTPIIVLPIFFIEPSLIYLLQNILLIWM